MGRPWGRNWKYSSHIRNSQNIMNEMFKNLALKVQLTYKFDKNINSPFKIIKAKYPPCSRGFVRRSHEQGSCTSIVRSCLSQA